MSIDLCKILINYVSLEDGLHKAQATTDVLFNRDIKSLINLSQKEMCEVFENAHTVSLVLTPGMNVLELAMAANCFPRRGKIRKIYLIQYVNY